MAILLVCVIFLGLGDFLESTVILSGAAELVVGDGQCIVVGAIFGLGLWGFWGCFLSPLGLHAPGEGWRSGSFPGSGFGVL